MRQLGIRWCWIAVFLLGCSSSPPKETRRAGDSVPAKPLSTKPAESVPAKKPKVKLKTGPSTQPEGRTTMQTDGPDLAAVVLGNNNFAFDLFRMLSGEQENIFFSPFSLSTALAMVYAESTAETERQMSQVLYYAHPQQKLHKRFATLLSGVNSAQGVVLQAANGLWPSVGFTFKSDCLAQIKTNYQTPITFLDYQAKLEPSRKTINKWAADNTKGKIKQLIAPGILSNATRLVLTNAIYFKGDWEKQFEKKKTKKGPFFLSEKKKINVPLMHQQAFFKFGEKEGNQWIELPYEGNEISMLIILPPSTAQLPELENRLNGETLNQWLTQGYKAEVDLILPKFETRSTFELSETLQAMEMKDAFDADKANFSKMASPEELQKNGNLYISVVIHQAYTKIDEKGTEAAAATAVGMKAASMPRLLRVDRPFIYLIRDRETGAILFLGRMSNPKRTRF